jgi:hypothetical protein
VNVIEQVGPERQSILEQIAGNGTVSTSSALRFASHEVLPDHHRVAGPQPIGARCSCRQDRVYAGRASEPDLG